MNVLYFNMNKFSAGGFFWRR